MSVPHRSDFVRAKWTAQLWTLNVWKQKDPFSMEERGRKQRQQEGSRSNGKLWSGSTSPASWTAVHGLERHRSQLCSQQIRCDLNPDKSRRRTPLTNKLSRCFPHSPPGSTILFPLHKCWLFRQEGSGCQPVNTCCTDHKEGERLVQPSLPFLLQARKASAWVLWSGQQATTSHPPLLGRAVSAHLHHRKHFSPSPAFFFSFVFFFVVLSFKQGTKHEGILGRMEASSLLHRMPKCSLQQMLSLGRGHASHSHLLKGHSQGGIKWAVPPSAKLCVTHGADRLVWGAAMFPREKSTFCNWVVRPT